MKLCVGAFFASILLFRAANPLAAHAGAPLAPHDLWSTWNLDPAVVLGLAAMMWLYQRGLAALWRNAGGRRGVRPAQVVAFYGGVLAIAAALVSPLDALSEVLFSAHMVQHLLLMTVAAPLLVWGAPAYVFLWAAPRRRRLARWWRRQATLSGAWRLLTAPLAAWLIHAAVLWVWHAPRFYQAALDHAGIHMLEHASFLTAALLFWWALLQPNDHSHLRSGVGMLMAFTTALHSGLLGTLLTFAARPWIPGYWFTTAQWGLTPLQDQQLAGVIMWTPGSVVYLATTLALLAGCLAAIERADAAREQRRLAGREEPAGMPALPEAVTHDLA